VCVCVCKYKCKNICKHTCFVRACERSRTRVFVCVCTSQIISADISLEPSVCKDMNLHVKNTIVSEAPNRLENIRVD
jgi:hypothetical protein